MILASLTLTVGAFADTAVTTPKAKTSAKAEKKAANTKGETIALDLTASKATWSGKKVTGTHTGTVAFKEGKFEVKNHTIASGEVVVDLNTIVDEDVKDAEWNKKLITHLKSPDFFDVAKNPTATFKITTFTEVQSFAPGEPNAIAKGTLTVHGITHPSEVKLFYTPSDTGFTAKGKLTIDRTLYGLKYNSKKFFDPKTLGDKLIDDNFDVDLSLVAKK